MAAKTWRVIGWEQCNECGDDVEVLTDAPEGMVGMDEDARCVACGLKGITDGDDDGMWINWSDPLAVEEKKP